MRGFREAGGGKLNYKNSLPGLYPKTERGRRKKVVGLGELGGVCGRMYM